MAADLDGNLGPSLRGGVGEEGGSKVPLVGHNHGRSSWFTVANLVDTDEMGSERRVAGDTGERMIPVVTHNKFLENDLVSPDRCSTRGQSDQLLVD